MLCRQITAVYSEIHTKHMNAMCGQNVEFFKFKPGGTYGLYRVIYKESIYIYSVRTSQ